MILRRVFHGEHGVGGFTQTGVAHLAAAFSVKHSAIKHQNGFIACRDGGDTFAILYDGQHLGLACHFLIAAEVCFRHIFKQIAFAEPGISTGILSRIAGAHLLLLHLFPESFLVHREAALRGNFLCEVKRETVRIVQAEGILTGDHTRVKVIQDIAEHLDALIDRLGEAFLFHTNEFLNHGTLFRKLRICGKIFVNHRFRNFGEERMVDAEQAAVTGGTGAAGGEARSRGLRCWA